MYSFPVPYRASERRLCIHSATIVLRFMVYEKEERPNKGTNKT